MLRFFCILHAYRESIFINDYRKMHKLKILSALFAVTYTFKGCLAVSQPENNFILTQEQHQDFQRYLERIAHEKEEVKIASLYEMPEGSDFLEITDRILADDYYLQHPKVKEEILNTGRRFFIFTYPSDGLKILGYVSFIPNAKDPKTIFIIRGGNRIFSLPRPGTANRIMGNHTYIETTLRDSINPGRDEFGGDDVNDVINLVKFIPKLRSKIKDGILQDRDIYMIGLSRGAMEMLLALTRSPWLQKHVKKAVSVVGILDMREFFKTRPDMVSLFHTDFRLTRSNKEAWIKLRNPIEHVHKLRKDLPILIIQAGRDIRVSSASGKNMVEKLKSLGHPVTYWEHKNKGHKFEGVDAKLEAWLDK